MKSRRRSSHPMIVMAVVVATLLLPIFGSWAADPQKKDSDSDSSSTTTSVPSTDTNSSSDSKQSSNPSPSSDTRNSSGPVTYLPHFDPGQFQVRLSGIGGYGNGSQPFSYDTHYFTTQTIHPTVLELKPVTTTTLQQVTVIELVPHKDGDITRFVPTPVTVTAPVTTTQKQLVPVTTTQTVKTLHTVHHTVNTAPIQGVFGGSSADATYFLTSGFGVGLEGGWFAAQHSNGYALTTFTERFPWKDYEFYLIGGSGVQYTDNKTTSLSQFGLGVDRQCFSFLDVFAEVSWLFGKNENAATFRIGFTKNFGL